MSALARAVVQRPGPLHDLTRLRIERALAKRARYRYVHPWVDTVEVGWVVQSPCCSRNVDPVGGDIPIAWIKPVEDGWALFSHEHSNGHWLLQGHATRLQELLDILCIDSQRVFWP
jgi:hypothetical protein